MHLLLPILTAEMCAEVRQAIVSALTCSLAAQKRGLLQTGMKEFATRNLSAVCSRAPSSQTFQ